MKKALLLIPAVVFGLLFSSFQFASAATVKEFFNPTADQIYISEVSSVGGNGPIYNWTSFLPRSLSNSGDNMFKVEFKNSPVSLTEISITTTITGTFDLLGVDMDGQTKTIASDLYTNRTITISGENLKELYIRNTSGSEYYVQSISLLGYDTPEDVTPPGDPSGVSVSNVTTDGADLSFTAPSDEDFDHFNIYLNGAFFTSTTGNNINFTDLQPGTLFPGSVTSVDKKGNESAGVPFSFNTLKAMADISALSADKTPDSFSFSWTNPDIDRFDHIEIYRDGAKIGQTADKTITSWTDDGLKSDQSYQYKFVSVGTDGDTSLGLSKTFTTVDILPPADVSNLRVSDIQDQTLTLTYSLPSDPDFDHVEIYRDGTKIGQTAENSFEDSGLAASQSYHYKVISVDDDGNKSEGKMISTQTLSQISNNMKNSFSSMGDKFKAIFTAQGLLITSFKLLGLVGGFVLLALAFTYAPRFIRFIRSSL